MGQDLPRFTIIIPQKNRSEYIGHTIRTCMMQDYPNLEILISDDCSDDDSVKVVQQLMAIDSRVKLFAHEKHLGMRDNFEFVLNQVKPGYVMALGGDDGLAPGAIRRMLEILRETNTQLLTWTPHIFYYPEASTGSSILCVRRYSKYLVKKLKSKDYLHKIAKSFNYATYDCPMFYIKGVASTELVDRVKSRTPDGSFYTCPTPDGFSGVVLAGEVDEYSFTNEPLSITGSSPKSQGKNYHRNDEQSKKESKEFFQDNLNRPMHPELASQQYSPLVTLMTADYLLRAKDLPGWPGTFPDISYEDLIKKTFLFLTKSTFKNDVLVRELTILRRIAEQHGQVDLFNKLLKETKRKVVWDKPVYGFALTNSIRIDGSKYSINNIFDASIAADSIAKVYHLVSLRGCAEMLKNSLKILFRQRHYKKESFPQI